LTPKKGAPSELTITPTFSGWTSPMVNTLGSWPSVPAWSR
jgi:hypothetical protein